MAAQGVVLFGGTFNPIHIGHLIVARAAAEHLGVGRVVLIPSANPPHKSGEELASPADRLEMARAATAGEPGFEVDDIELRREGPSYTVLTVRAFRRRLGDEVPLFWLIGADTLSELAAWYRTAELVSLCRIVTAVRPGYDRPDTTPLRRVLSAEHVRRLEEDIIPTPRIDISATDIRRRVREGRSIRFLVPDAVADRIVAGGLYRRA